VAISYDSWEGSDKAHRLLTSLLKKNERNEYMETGFLRVNGRKHSYVLAAHGQTEVRDKRNRLIAYACLQLTVAAPVYDRMIAEYLLLKNDEDLYWRTANIFRRGPVRVAQEVIVVALVAFDIALAVNLLLEVLSSR